MNHNNSEIVVDSDNKSSNEITATESSKSELETQTVSVINSATNNSFELQKFLIVCGALVLTLTAFLLFAKGTEVCLFSTCNDYTDSVGTGESASIGNDFVAYVGGAATLTVLTTLMGVPLLPAIIASAGVWFLLQMIN